MSGSTSSTAGATANGIVTSPTAVPVSTATVSTTVPSDEPSPTDLLLGTPAPLLKLFAVAQPFIATLNKLAGLLTWADNFWQSLLLLFAWWAACLFGELVLRYGLNLVIIVGILITYLKRDKGTPRRKTSNTLTPTSYAALLQLSNELAGHLQQLDAPLAKITFPRGRIMRFLLTSYPFYLALTYFVPLHIIILHVGSVIILWHAPFFTTLRTALWSSATIRWFVRVVVAILSAGEGLRREIGLSRKGHGVPGMLHKTVVSPKRDDEALTPSDKAVQLRFVVFENQRWWLGLEWTHALLPGERASWTDPMNQPSLPPSSFALPAPHITYEPLDPKTARKTGKTRRKKIQEWQWVDKEWSVQLAVPGASEHSTNSPPASPAAADTATKSAVGPKSGSPTIAGEVHETIESNRTILKPPSAIAAIAGQREEVDLFRDYHVDAEGWMYGDNHFEKMTSKGGLGKYTRRRAWVRKAALVERVELVGDEDRGKDSASARSAAAAAADKEKEKKGDSASGGEDTLRRRRRSSTRSGADLTKKRSSSSSGGTNSANVGKATVK